ncbi:MAG: hypothetical protein R6U94_02455 [Nitriliruptoraceae bacterium]
MADRRFHLRLPPRTGLALGLVLGMTVGVVLGRLVDLRALGMVLGLVLGLVFGLLLDNDRAAEDRFGEEDPGAGSPGEDGAIARALLWILAGLVLLVLLALLIAPELLAAPGRLTAVLLAILAAGVPGVVLLLVLVGRRRRIDAHQRREGDA